MSLNLLSSEVLAQILNGKNSWAALELWKTGDHALRSKLKKGGITHMDLSSSRRLRFSNDLKWPRCLKEFELVSLRMKGGFAPCDGEIIRNEFMRPHPTLETLSLQFFGALVLFSETSPHAARRPRAGNRKGAKKSSKAAKPIQFDMDDIHEGDEAHGRDFEGPPSKRPKRASHPSERVSYHTWSPSRLFPALTSLTLIEMTPIRRATLISLPSVTHLTLLSEEPVDLSQLVSLKSLNMLATPFDYCSIETIDTCPKSLTAFETDAVVFSDLALQDDFAKQFPHLTSIRGPFSLSGNESTLSSAVKTITLSSAKLPPIEPNWKGPEDLVLSQKVSITDLASRLAQWTNLSALRLHSTDFLPSQLHLLPRTLRHLQYVDNTLHDYKEARKFGMASIKGPDASSWSNHKHVLLAYGSTSGGGDMAWVKAYIDRVENGSLCGLPLGLSSLCITNGPLKPEELETSWRAFADAIVLPPRLRQFDRFATFGVGSDFLELLPPFLNELNLRLGDNPAHPTQDQHIRFTALRFLRIIKLSSLPSVQHASRIMAILPQGLASLTIGFNSSKEQLDEAFFLALPFRLETLKIEEISVAPSDSGWAKQLPRGLTCLDVSMHIEASDLAHLPPMLTALTVSGIHSATARALLSAPRSLSSFVGATSEFLEDCKESGSKKTTAKEEKDALSSKQLSAVLTSYLPFWRIFQKTEAEILREISKS